jgi:hypothetical protein
MNWRRIVLAILLGLLCGLFCMWTTSETSSNPISFTALLAVGYNRIILGLVVGLSGKLMIRPVLRGAIIGIFISLEIALPSLNSWFFGFVAYMLAGIVYGIIIDSLSSWLAKEKIIN